MAIITYGRNVIHSVAPLQLAPHIHPVMLDRIENGGISWPVHDAEGVHNLLQPAYDYLALMAECTLLEESLGLEQLHEKQQVVFQDHLVANTSHGFKVVLGGRKKMSPLPSFSLKHPCTVTLKECFMVGIMYCCL
jgi:hypothetical protein